MNSPLLQSIGLGNLDLGLVLIVLTAVLLILLVLLILNIRKVSLLKRKYEFFMKGRAAKSLESEVVEMFSENRAMREDIDQILKDIDSIYSTLRTTYQKMGLVKYDAFGPMGGKLSFCLALLNEENDGFLLNSVHGNDSSYSYIKRIVSGKCKGEISGEEEVALRKALGEKENDEA